MQGIFSCAFDQIDESNPIELVEKRRLREHINLDYKLKAYDHKHSGAINLLADVTAMANARGGYILIGVEEDREAPDGTPKRLVGIEQGDVEVNWIQSVCLSSIDEKINGLRVKDIPLSNGFHCVVIEVPNSIRKPHMIVHEKHRSFRVRHGRSNTIVGMQEVRNMILSMNSYRVSLQDFIIERKNSIRSLAPETPWLLLMTTPIYIDSDKIDPLLGEYRDLLERVPGVPDPSFEGIRVGTPKPRIFGVEARPYNISQIGIYRNLLRLFRNGHFEYFEDYSSFAGTEWPSKAMPIYSYGVTVTLLHFLEIAKRVSEIGEVSEPYAISLILGNVNPSYLHPWRRPPVWLDDVFIWQERDLTIQLTANDLDSRNELASALIDHLFNAYGHDKNLHFNEEKELIRQKR